MALRLRELSGRTSPRPIDIVVSNRDEDEIGKSRRCEQPADLSRKIARPENATKKILAIAFVVDKRADTGVFHRNKRGELFQSFRHTPNAGR